MKTYAMKIPEWQRITRLKTNPRRGLLITNWTLNSGRTLRPDIRPADAS